MRTSLIALCLLGIVTTFTGCHRRLDTQEVRRFIDRADEAARKRFAPDICKLRGKTFTQHLEFQSDNVRTPPTRMDIGRPLYCQQAAQFSHLRQYKLERKALAVDLATDRKTARVTIDYVETLPYYEPDVRPATPDDFRQWQIVETRDESVVGIESGDIVFLSTDSSSKQKLVGKDSITLPYD